MQVNGVDPEAYFWQCQSRPYSTQVTWLGHVATGRRFMQYVGDARGQELRQDV